MNRCKWSLAALSATALALLGLGPSPLSQLQSTATLVERVALLETAVVVQAEHNQN